MPWLLFMARVAFICNIFFVLCFLLRHTQIPLPQALNGFIIIVGWIMSVMMNVALHSARLYVYMRKQPTGLPAWLAIVNLIFLLFQLAYFIFSD